MPGLSTFDEYPIHQTPEPVAFPASSDRNVYDRNWFGGFPADGSYYFGFTMGIYPNRGVVDCGFSLLDDDGVQHCLLASARLTEEVAPLVAGPVTMEVVRPMRRVRIVIADNETGISADLTFSARTGAVREPRQVMWTGTRRTTDATRYNQYGRWSGWITAGGRTLEVRDEVCLGIKDRSWGVRRLGEREAAGPVAPTRPMFVWPQVFWDDHVTHGLIFDDQEGTPLVRDAADLPLHATEDDVVGIEAAAVRYSTLHHRVAYHPGTRWAKQAEIDLVRPDGSVRTLTMEPLLRFHQRGVGYHHPEFPHGVWQGERVVRHERFRPSELDPDGVENVHVQNLVRVTDGSATGVGILEQFILGPYLPAGFTDPLGPAPSRS